MKIEPTLTVFSTGPSESPQGQAEGTGTSRTVRPRHQLTQNDPRTLSARRSQVLEENQLLTVDEFADQLRVTRACVRRWILERRVAVVKVGRLVRLPVSEVRRIVEQGSRPALWRGPSEDTLAQLHFSLDKREPGG